MASSPVKCCYVFGMSPTGEPVLAGKLELRRVKGVFRYDEQWLDYEYNYPLDPVNIPLGVKEAVCNNTARVFPVFSDAAPDVWGTRIMLLQHEARPQNELERLLRTSGGGVGTLQYSLSRTRPKRIQPSQDISLLKQLFEVAELIDDAEPPAPEMLRLIQPGSSMGGARPKVSVHDETKEYLAKFSRATDLVDIPRVEFATMQMLADTRLVVPRVLLEPVGRGCSAYLIERFDISRQGTTHHYLSAHALFNVDRIRELQDGHQDSAGYVSLAHHLRGHSANPVHDCEQLFLRALTNIMLGNTDDHARNFGMTYSLVDRQWGLAPVFDVLPIVSGIENKQAMTLGVYGRESSWRNLASCVQAFGLSDERARKLAQEHLSVLSDWERYYLDAGISPGDMRLLKTVIQPRLLNFTHVKSS